MSALSRRVLILIAAVFLTLLVFFLIFFLVLKVEEISMAPALYDGQWLLVIRGTTKIRSGDIAVYRSPTDENLVVKRCVLTAGDLLVVENGWLVAGKGRWFLTGPQKDYLSLWDRVPDDNYFFVGDNQFHSLDSREYGFVEESQVVGRVLLRKER